MIIIGLIIIATYQYHFINFTWDDPFITWRYAENLTKGIGIVFNEGERVEGYSNLLYVLIFALLYKLHVYWGELRLLYPAKIMGSLTSFGLIWFTLKYATRLRSFRELGYPKAAIIIGFIAVINPYLHIWAMCGMETLLYPFLTLLGNLVLIDQIDNQNHGKIKSFIIAGLIFFLVSITRADGFVIVFATLVFLFFLLLRKTLTLRQCLVFFFSWLIPSLIVLAWRYWYYGDIFPMSYYSKATGGWPQIVAGLSQWWLGARTILGSFILYLFIYLPIFARKGRPGPAYSLIFSQALVYQLYIIYSGTDWLLGDRFFTHIIPQFELMLFAGISELLKLDPKFKTPLLLEHKLDKYRLRLIILIIVLIAGLNYQNISGFLVLKHGHFTSGYKNITDYLAGHAKNPWPSWMMIEYYDAGIWMKQNAKPTDLLAIGDIGAIPYISGVKVIDCLGLTDKYIAKLPGNFFYQKADIDYILGDKPGYNETRPDFIILEGFLRQGKDNKIYYEPWSPIFNNYMVLLFNDQRFQERYQLVYQKDFFLVFKLRSG